MLEETEETLEYVEIEGEIVGELPRHLFEKIDDPGVFKWPSLAISLKGILEKL